MNQPAFADVSFGLFVGISEFLDSTYAQQPLSVAANDATELKATFTRHLGWRDANIEVLAGKVTRKEVATALRRADEKIRSLESPGVFVFYLSTHGHLYENHLREIDRSCLLAYDTDTANAVTIFESGLTGSMLGTYIGSNGAADRLVILDTCFAAQALKLPDFVKDVVPEGSGAAVLASSSGLASYQPGRSNSDSTHRLLGALKSLGGSPGGISCYRLLAELEDGEPAWIASTTIRGRLLIGYVGERPPADAVGFIDILEWTASRIDIYVANARNFQPDRYVERERLESQFDRFLEGEDTREVFTIVGAAGSGKTTSSLRLAKRARDLRRPVLWLPSTEVNCAEGAAKTLRTSLRALGPELSDEEVWARLPEPMVVILDAVNEWEGEPECARRYLSEWMEQADQGRVRLAWTCRSRDWQDRLKDLAPGKNRVFEPEYEGVSVALGAFKGAEIERARAVFGSDTRVDAPELKRQPLFVRMIATLGPRLPAPGPEGTIGFVSVFDAYVSMLVDDAAARVSQTPEEVRGAVLGMVKTLHARGLEALPTNEFLDGAGEAVGLALLDSGLFRRVGASVAVEAEMLHEYLLSLLFQDRAVDALLEGTPNPVNRRLMQGAAGFDLARISDPERVKPLLRAAAARYRHLALDLMPELPRLSEYTDFYVEFFAGDPLSRYVSDRLEFVLERDAGGDFEFTIEMVRAMFRQIHYYDWERKRWPARDWEDFREAVSRAGDRAGLVLLRALELHPERGMRILLDTWLFDQTKLREGGPSDIRGVAVTFLSAAGRRTPEIFVELAREKARDAEFRRASVFNEIIREVAPAVPELFKPLAVEWFDSMAETGYLAMTILTVLPTSEVDFALEQVRDVMRYTPMTHEQSVALVGVLARYGGRKVFRYLEELAATPHLRSVVLSTLKYMEVADPQVPLEIAARIAAEPELDAKAMFELASFYAKRMTSAPEAAVAIFRRALANDDEPTEREVSSEIGNAAATHPAVTEFVEERLRVSPNTPRFEYYRYYLRKLRKYGDSDMHWLRRYTIADGYPPKLDEIAGSDLSFDHQVELALLLETHHDGWWQNEHNDTNWPAVVSFATQFRSDPRFAQLGEEAAKWLELISGGATAREAVRAIYGY